MATKRKPADVREHMEKAAIYYARRGWRVAPAHRPLKTGRCSSGRDDCPTIGKHPRIKNWLEEATTDEDQNHLWFREDWNTPSSILIVPGRDSTCDPSVLAWRMTLMTLWKEVSQ